MKTNRELYDQIMHALTMEVPGQELLDAQIALGVLHDRAERKLDSEGKTKIDQMEAEVTKLSDRNVFG